jgi:hypothetical protein
MSYRQRKREPDYCMTFCYPPGHPLYEFNPDRWAAAVAFTLPRPSAPGIILRTKLATNSCTKLNKNSRRKAKEQSKAFVQIRKAGGSIESPPSRRRSRWRGALFNRRPQTAEAKIAGFGN